MSQIPPVPPPIPPQPAPRKKGLPALAWVAIGCGGLLVIAIAVTIFGGYFLFHKAGRFIAHPETTLARIIAAGNPDLEVVTVDEGSGIVTVRNKKTGEVLTINIEDAKRGKIVFKGANGEKTVIETPVDGQAQGIRITSDKGFVNIANGTNAEAGLPKWIPSWPGVEIQSIVTGREGGKHTGMYQFQVDSSVADAMDFCEQEFKKAGFTPAESTHDLGGQNAGGVLTVDANGKNASVTFARDTREKKTTVAVVFEEKE